MADVASAFVPSVVDRPVTVRHFLDRPVSQSAAIDGSGSRRSATHSSSSALGGLNRSSSMRSKHVSSVELNAASLDHVRRLLAQLLRDHGIPNPERWESALLPILLQATDDLDPDVRAGDNIDVRSFVKLKRIPGGVPNDSSYLSGVVFTKNLALKSMPRSIPYARILLIAFPIEFKRNEPEAHRSRLRAAASILSSAAPTLSTPTTQASATSTTTATTTAGNVRSNANAAIGSNSIVSSDFLEKDVFLTKKLHSNANSQQFMSLEQVMQLEREYIQKLVAGIVARKPSVVLVEHGISGMALSILQKKNIAVAYNVNPRVMHAVSRSTGADIVTSAEILMNDYDLVNPPESPHVGNCGTFEIKTYVLDQTTKKTFIFMSQCPRQLACTIVLRGGDMDTLHKIKYITNFMVYVVYNLRLETCLMRDESVFNPAPGSTYSKNKLSSRMTLNNHDSEIVNLNEDGTTGYYDNLVNIYNNRIVSTSPFVHVSQPYLLSKARNIERRLQVAIKATEDFDHTFYNEMNEKDSDGIANVVMAAKNKDIENADEAALKLVGQELLNHLPGRGEVLLKETQHAILQLERDKLEYALIIQKRQWEVYLSQFSRYLFDPFMYQHITILYSLSCQITTAPCTGPELVSIQYYHDGDCTLGQFIEGICDTADQRCSDGCSYILAQHYRSYVHDKGRINVNVEKVSCRIPGMENTILMWSHCNICNVSFPPVPMSEDSWKYSFGKFLELSFNSSPLSPRAEVCPHDIHKDHVRIFGLRNLAVKFEYRPIELLEIAFPRTQLLWKPQIDIRLRVEEFVAIEGRIERFFDSVQARLDSVRVDEFTVSDRSEDARIRIELLRERAINERQDLQDVLETIYKDSNHRDYLQLNRVIRTLQEQVVQWDLEFADFDRLFFPSEKDIARLTAMQLKKMFVERDSSSTSLTGEEHNTEMSNHSTDLSSAVELMPVAATDRTTPTDTQITPSIAGSAAPVDYLGYNVLKSPEYPLGSIGFPSPGLSTSTKADPLNQVPSLKRSSQQSMTKAVLSANAVATIDSSDTDLSKKSVPTLNMNIPPAVEVQEPTPIEQQNDNQDELEPTTSTPILNSTSEASTTIMAPKQGSIYKRRYPPDRIQLPAQFKHRFTQGTTRELARQLQLSRAGEMGSHGVPASNNISASVSSFTVSSSAQNKVVSLARHFDQLSKEFEKERAKERRKLAAGRSRMVLTSKPIVEVYKTIEDAVVEEEDDDESEIGQSDDDAFSHSGTIFRRSKIKRPRKLADSLDSLVVKDDDRKPLSPVSAPQANYSDYSGVSGNATHESTDNDVGTDTSSVLSPRPIKSPLSNYFSVERLSNAQDEQQVVSIEDQKPKLTPKDDVDKQLQSDVPQKPKEQVVTSGMEMPPVPERVSLMTMLSNFWADRSASGWKALDYPLQPSEHIFMDSDVIVREDEPSSLIAFCLSSPDYVEKLRQIRNADAQVQNQAQAETGVDNYDTSSVSSNEDVKPVQNSDPNVLSFARVNSEGDPSTPNPANQSSKIQEKSEDNLRKWLLKETGTHLKYQFQEGSAKLSCKIFYAELFDAFRTLCGCEESYIQSLSRCVKWDSTGGKSGSAFLKTLDDRLIVKQLSPAELDSFIKFAPSYFQYMDQVFFHDLPSVIAKIMGFYQVQVRNPITNKSMKMDILVMENLFYDRNLTRIFDLKGSMRNRHVEQTGKANEVLLDENMVEYIFESPLFVREHAKKVLRASLWNDTLFLAKMNVMDYSLVIAIDQDKQQLVVGIIDCLRTFTWDKKLESWVKERGLVGGGGKVPTVVTPRQYKNRFREAMERYILMVPE
ncbi:hypothetical protein V1514DRAFT_330808 [Lipomyces japonicus]|uniref:uncharacterized protein n=1 Tax=Lipomyces japonicus TaxID=56871 RepID=UPI0034CEF5D2